jgi:hypothetical protein
MLIGQIQTSFTVPHLAWQHLQAFPGSQLPSENEGLEQNTWMKTTQTNHAECKDVLVDIAVMLRIPWVHLMLGCIVLLARVPLLVFVSACERFASMQRFLCLLM